MEETGKEWQSECWVVRLRDIRMYDRLQDLVFLNQKCEIRLRYLGDNLILISGLDESGVTEKINNEDESFLSVFHNVQRWNPNVRTQNRIV